jgi:5-methylthioadenosine/S-adenosylhomocysteine deaminase
MERKPEPDGGGGPAVGSLRIRDATILTQDDARHAVEGDLYVEDGRVTHVGRIPGNRDADRILDGRGQVVLPGLVNLHTHLAMTLLRGHADDMHLEAWLRERVWPAEERIQEPHMRAGVELGLLELISSGTTSFVDMYWMEDTVVAPASSKAGVRAWAGEGMVDIGQTEAGQPNRKVALVERSIKANRDPLVTFCPSPHGTYTCHQETYAESARVAREHQVPLHTHCGETRTEVYSVQQATGMRPLARLDAAVGRS